MYAHMARPRGLETGIDETIAAPRKTNMRIVGITDGCVRNTVDQKRAASVVGSPIKPECGSLCKL
jgi:hypothetical protein